MSSLGSRDKPGQRVRKKRDDATRMSWLSPPDIEVLLLPSSSSRLGVSSPTPLIDDRIDKSRDEKA